MTRQWEYKRIGDVCIVERGGSPRPIDDYITEDPDGVNWIKIGDTTESMFITQTAQKIKPDCMKKSRYVQPGDFLLSNSMSFGRPYILKIDGCIHDGWLVLRDKDGLFDKRFLYYYLSAKPTYEKFKQMAVGGVVNNLNSEMVRKVEVPIPRREEQTEIADLLDKINNTVIHRRQQLSTLDTFIKARFFEMFGDPEYNNMGWPIRNLSDLCNVGSSKRIYQEEQTTDGVPFWRISDLVTKMDTGNVESSLYIPESRYAELKTQDLVPEPGDILVTSRGTLGRCYIVSNDDRFYFQDGMISWLSKYSGEITPLYIQYLFDMPGFRKQIDSMQAGSTVAYLSIAMLKRLDIMLPDRTIQNQFSDFVAQVDKSKLSIQASLDQLEILKQSMIQKYFG